MAGARLLRGDDPDEAPLLAAEERSRALARTRLQRDLGLDPTDPVGTSGPDGFGRFAPPSADPFGTTAVVAAVIAHHDLGSGLDGPRSRLVVERGAAGPIEPRLVRRRATFGEPLRIRPTGLDELLSSGGGLTIRGLDHAAPHLVRLLYDVEVVTGVRADLAAAVLGMGAIGPSARQDRIHAILLQTSGSSDWVLTPPTLDPRPRTDDDTIGAFVARLETGDGLVVPHGWGHRILASDGRSMHVALHLHRPTGADAGLDGAAADLTGWSATARSRLPGRTTLRTATALELRATLDAHTMPPRGSWRVVAPGGVAVTTGADPHLVVGGLMLPRTGPLLALLSALSAPDGTELHIEGEEQRLALLALLTHDLLDRAIAPDVDVTEPAAPGPVRRAPWRASTFANGQAAPGEIAHGPHDDDRGGVDGDLAGLAAASTRRRRAAIEDLAVALPGLDVAALTRSNGAVPTTTELGETWRDRLTGTAAVDDVLASRDLADGRMAVAHGAVARNRPAPAGVLPDPRSHAPQRVSIGGLADLLHGGATTILFAVDESAPALAELAELLEEATGRRSGVNTYLSHGSHPSGFGVHWDDHDVLIVQAAGAKTWTLHPPTEPFPVLGITPEAVVTPPERIVDLQPGDVLLVPHGWGHAVVGHPGTGAGDLSVHHTFSLRGPDGRDAVRAHLADRSTRLLDIGQRWRSGQRRRFGWEAPDPMHPLLDAGADLAIRLTGAAVDVDETGRTAVGDAGGWAGPHAAVVVRRLLDGEPLRSEDRTIAWALVAADTAEPVAATEAVGPGTVASTRTSTSTPARSATTASTPSRSARTGVAS